MFAGLENHAIHYLLSVGAYVVENKHDKGNIKRFPRFLGKGSLLVAKASMYKARRMSLMHSG